MKTVAIVNPVSGFRRAPREWPHLVKQAGALASDMVTWWTKCPGHAEFLAAQAKRSGFERVLAVGGDGTIFEVVNGLWWEPEGRLPSLGIVPFGTGNDYVRNFEMGTTRFSYLINALKETSVCVDAVVFCLKDDHGKVISRVTLNFLGAGFDARVVARHRQQRSLGPGKLPYFFCGFQELFKLRRFRVEGEIDRQPFKGRSLIFVIGLGRYFGSGMMITPFASPQAGLCQLVWDQQLSGLNLILLLTKIYRGKHLLNPKVLTCLAREVKLVTDPPVLVEADGELIGWTPLGLEVYPQVFHVASKKIKSPSTL